MQTNPWPIARFLAATVVAFRTSPWMFLLLAVALTGCGQSGNDPRSFHVHGEATFDGKPIPRGGVTFDPDGSKGNTGPQGYAEIIDGKFDTHQNGKGTTGGDQIVTITAYDGKATEDNPEGKPLFFGWKTNVTFADDKNPTMNFDVKKSDKSFEATFKP